MSEQDTPSKSILACLQRAKAAGLTLARYRATWTQPSGKVTTNTVTSFDIAKDASYWSLDLRTAAGVLIVWTSSTEGAIALLTPLADSCYRLQQRAEWCYVHGQPFPKTRVRQDAGHEGFVVAGEVTYDGCLLVEDAEEQGVQWPVADLVEFDDDMLLDEERSSLVDVPLRDPLGVVERAFARGDVIVKTVVDGGGPWRTQVAAQLQAYTCLIAELMRAPRIADDDAEIPERAFTRRLAKRDREKRDLEAKLASVCNELGLVASDTTEKRELRASEAYAALKNHASTRDAEIERLRKVIDDERVDFHDRLVERNAKIDEARADIDGARQRVAELEVKLDHQRDELRLKDEAIRARDEAMASARSKLGWEYPTESFANIVGRVAAQRMGLEHALAELREQAGRELSEIALVLAGAGAKLPPGRPSVVEQARAVVAKLAELTECDQALQQARADLAQEHAAHQALGDSLAEYTRLNESLRVGDKDILARADAALGTGNYENTDHAAMRVAKERDNLRAEVQDLTREKNSAALEERARPRRVGTNDDATTPAKDCTQSAPSAPTFTSTNVDVSAQLAKLRADYDELDHMDLALDILGASPPERIDQAARRVMNEVEALRRDMQDASTKRMLSPIDQPSLTNGDAAELESWRRVLHFFPNRVPNEKPFDLVAHLNAEVNQWRSLVVWFKRRIMGVQDQMRFDALPVHERVKKIVADVIALDVRIGALKCESDERGRVLAKHQWCAGNDSGDWCPECGEPEPDHIERWRDENGDLVDCAGTRAQHKPGCAWLAALPALSKAAADLT